MRNLNEMLERNKDRIDFFSSKLVIPKETSTKERDPHKRDLVVVLEIQEILSKKPYSWRRLSKEEKKELWGRNTE